MNPVHKGGVQKTLAEHIKNNSVRTWLVSVRERPWYAP